MNNEYLKIKERKYRGETEVISARLPSELVRDLEVIAQQSGRSRNEIIELCLTFAIHRVKIEQADE